ncbi:C1 family peptidase [Microbacterium profundi]|uniref:C1 family peptidase n=1 Tax=Microbacterium profundi TaxID=450380 RepID=A0ABV3LF70_9MICO
MGHPDVDLRDLVGADILDQGMRPTCVTFAASAAHEAMRTLQGEDAEHLSPEALWAYCSTNGTASVDGMLLADAGPALENDGQPLLRDWPYADTARAAPSSAGAPPWHRAALVPLELSRDGVEAEIEDQLQTGVPVILILETTDEFLLTDADGFIAVPDIRAGHGGYHAVTCVGAATHPTAGRHLLVKNSWGEEWGAGGYGWLPLDYLRGFGAQAATVGPRNEVIL